MKNTPTFFSSSMHFSNTGNVLKNDCDTLAIGAHSDDVEIFAASDAFRCRGKGGFAAVTVCDGIGSLRRPEHEKLSDEEFKKIREDEQREAAKFGEYGLAIMLGKPSSSVKRCEPQVVSDIAEIIKCLKPQNLVTHSPFDFHSTHVATVACVFLALMKLKADERPQKVFGCEVWGSLDWVPSRFRVLRPTGFDIEWEKKLIGFHRSQVTSEKDYALGALGRRLANAVFSEQKENSKSNGGIWSLDLTQAMEGGLDRYCEEVLAAFSAERMNELNNYKKDF